MVDERSSLHLDPRQRAMLREMGIEFWWPTAQPVALAVAAEDTADAPKIIADSARSASVSARFDSKTKDIAARGDAPARIAAQSAAPASIARAAEAFGPGGAVRIGPAVRLYRPAGEADEADDSVPAPRGGWLIVADMPPAPDGPNAPFAGDAGRLLDNMLRALRLHEGAAPVHLASVHRAAGAQHEPAGDSALSDGFAQHADALAPALVLALGPLAAQGLLQSNEPLGKLRGRVAAVGARPDLALVASYPPAYLLRNQADKAKAWADLCLAADVAERR